MMIEFSFSHHISRPTNTEYLVFLLHDDTTKACLHRFRYFLLDFVRSAAVFLCLCLRLRTTNHLVPQEGQIRLTGAIAHIPLSTDGEGVVPADGEGVPLHSSDVSSNASLLSQAPLATKFEMLLQCSQQIWIFQPFLFLLLLLPMLNLSIKLLKYQNFLL